MSDYLNHRSPGGHYRIDYPSDWMHLSVSATDAFFFSRLQGPDDDFSDHISIRAEDVTRTAGRDLDTLAQETVASLRRADPSFTVDATGDDRLSGRPAIRLGLRSNGKQSLRYDTVIVVDEPLAFHLTYTAEADHFDVFSEVFQTMLDSFTLGRQP